jgi:UDP-glucose 4-epimerase
MRILIIGGAGYVGSHLTRALLHLGDEVVVVDNLVSGHRKLLPQSVPFFKVDGGFVFGIEDILQKFTFDACVICSLIGGGARALHLPFHYYHNNFISVFYLLQTLVKHGIRRVILASSLDVYGANPPNPITEDSPFAPSTPLGKSLCHCEDLLLDLVLAEGLSCIVFHMGDLGGALSDGSVGAWPNSSERPIVTAMDVAFGSREDFPICGNNPVCDILHISDAIEAIQIALRRLGNRPACEVFNLASGTSLPLLQILKIVESITHREIPTRSLEALPVCPSEIHVDPTRAVRELWKHAPLPIDRVIHDAWEWRKKCGLLPEGHSHDT